VKIWVDVESGTYGTDPDNIYVVSCLDGNEDLLDGLMDSMSDRERASYAKAFGTQLKLMGCEDVAHKVAKEPEVYGSVEDILHEHGIEL
jgi:hypothetical protein